MNSKNQRGYNPLTAAILSHRPDTAELVELLLAHGADAHQRCPYDDPTPRKVYRKGDTPLEIAINLK